MTMMIGKGSGLPRALVAAAAAASLAGPLAYANPVGPVVVSGQAAVQSSGALLSVTNSPGAIINWQQFSIGAGETTRFIQQSAASAVLNRVMGADPSRIFGALQSNGRVFLINPSGIVFGPNSQIDVAGLVASTLNLSNADFLAKRLNFTGDPGRAAAVVNQGRITTSPGGHVYLVGAAVDNQGLIASPNGDVILAAGRSVRVTEGAISGVNVEITAPADRALNLSEALYGSRGIYAGLVRNSGRISADSAVRGADGRITLKASGGVTLDSGSRVTANGPDGGRIVVDAQQGPALVSGSLEATGGAGHGGSIAIAGEQTSLADGARADASGASSGGTVLIGGDLRGAAIRDGEAALSTSQHTYVAPSAQITADAREAGDGGRVVVWADESTRFYGAISARGGASGGDGGTVEVSGKQSLVFKGAVDTRAPRGATGTLLLDPASIVIQDGTGDGNDSDALNNSFSGTPSGTAGTVLATDSAPTVIFQSELQGIAGTTNISLAATNSITINDLASNNLNLAQVAGRSVSFQSGTFSMDPGDTITTAGGALSITTTAGGAAIGGLATGGGAVLLDVAGASTVAGAISGAGTTLTKQGAGTLTLNAASSYTGTTTVSAGTLALGANNALPGTTTVVVNGGGTLDIAGFNQTLGGVQLAGGTIAGTTGTLTSTAAFDVRSGTVGAILGGAVGLNKTTAGTVTLSRSNTYTGATTVGAGTLALGADNVLADAGAVVVSGGTFSIAGFNDTVAAVQLQSGSITGTGGTLTATTPYDLQAGTVSAILGGAVGLTKTTTGAVTLSGANTYTGATAVNAGVLNLQNATAAGTTAGGVTVASGAALELQGGISVGNESLSIAGTGVGGSGALRNVSGDNAWGGTVTLTGGGATIQSDANTLTLGAATAVTGAAQNLTVAGAGNVSTGGTIATTTGTVTKTGAGTLALTAANLLSATGSLVVNGGTLDMAGFNETVAAVQLQSGTITGTSGILTSTSNYDLQAGTVSAIITGAVGVTKTTAGTVTLTRANTYTGATAVNAGTLAVTANDALGTTGAGTTVAAGATLDFQNVAYTTLEPLTLNGGTVAASTGTSSFSNAVSLTGNSGVSAGGGALLSLPGVISGAGLGITMTGGGTVVLSGNNTYTGTTMVSGGTLAIGASERLANASSLVVSGGTFDIGAFNETVAGVQLQSGSITGTSGVLTSSSSYDLQSGGVSAIITGTVGVNKTTGGTVVLTRANTYTGATAISAGTLAVTANDALGTTGAGTTVAAGGVLDLQNVAYTTLEPLTLNGGAIATTTGISSFSNAITLTATSGAFVASGAQLTLPGVISGAGLGLTKTGAGTLVLSGNNTYTGTTTVSDGTLALGASERLNDSSNLVVNGGTFDIGPFNETVAGVHLLSGTITGTSGILTSTSNYDLQSGTVSAIITGSVGVDKTGPGTITLTRANTYTGATAVNAGTLAVTSNDALGTIGAGTTVQSGATLDFQNVAYTSLEPLTLNGGTVATSTGTSSFAGPTSLTADSTASVTGVQLTLSGVISESGGTFGLTKVGAGTLVLSAHDTYKGTTRINAGTVQLGVADALDDLSKLVVNGGTFDIVSFNDTVAEVHLLSGTITGTSGILTSTSNYDLQSGTVSAIITGSVGADKTTAGTVTLSRDNTYTGATAVAAGTLRVTAPNALGTTTAGTTVTSGATLAIVNTAVVEEPVTLNGDGVGGIGAMTGTGTASLAGPVTVNTASTIGVAAAADSLTLAGVVEGPGALSLIGSGTVAFGNTVGAATALASLTQNAATRLKINGGLVRTAGNQTYNGPVTTGGAATLRTTAGGNVSAPGAFNATAGTLTLDTGAGGATLTNTSNDFSTVAITSGGVVSLVDANSITIGPASMSKLTARALSGNLALGGNVIASGGGDSIVLVASANFVNNAGAAALDPGPGRWLVYSTNPALDTRGGLAYDFKQYHATFGVTAVADPGSGFLYTVAPSVTPVLTGTVSKVYDATAAATLSTANYTFPGALDEDTIDLNNATSGVYDTPDVGTSKLVSVSALSLAGPGAHNQSAKVYGYQLAATSASGNVGVVTPADLKITPNDQSKTYGDAFTFTGTEFSSSGLRGGQTIGNVALASDGAPATAHVAGSPYPITASGASGGTFTPSNYTITFESGQLAVSPAQLTVTANDQVKAYGGSPFVFSGTEFTASGLKNADAIDRVTLTSAATSPIADVAGSPYPIVPSAAAGINFVASDYAITYKNGSFTVNPAGVALTVTANDQVKTYGTTFVFSGTEFSTSGLQNNETVGHVVLASPGAPASAHVSDSPYPIEVSGASGGTFKPGNYTITYVPGKLTVVPAPLTIKADDKSRLAGLEDPLFTATYTGFMLAETPAVLKGELKFATLATKTSPAGTYPIRPSGQTATDYAITFLDGTLTVRPSRVGLPPTLTDQAIIALEMLGIDDFNRVVENCLGEDIGSPAVIVPRGLGLKPPRNCTPGAADESRIRRPRTK